MDHVSDLSAVVVNGETNPCYQKSIISSVGGNAIFFAEAAREAGFDTISVLCSVGDDLAGSQVLDHLGKLGAVVHATPSMQPTGRVIIIFQPEDRRIMIADRGANVDLRAPEGDALSALARNHDLLYISGYMLLEAEQRASVHKIAGAFHAAGAQVVVDMVPHDIWRTASWEEYMTMCACGNCVAAELGTVSALRSGIPNALGPEDAAALLLERFEFCILRIDDLSEFLIADSARRRFFSVPYRRVNASLRFTDRVIAATMKQYLLDTRSLFESDRWLAGIAHAGTGETI